jgi:Ferric reductase like transmembrane component/Class III cytochrome C family
VLTLALAAVGAAALGAVGAGRAWGLADGLGLLSLFLAVAVTAWPVRPRVAPTPRATTLSLHRLLGFLALGLALLHTAGLVVAEPLLLEHLKPTAPVFMLAGLLALVLLGVLCVTGLWSVRRHFPGSGAFQLIHIALAALLLVLLGVHAIGAARYLRAAPERGAFVLAVVVSLLVVLRARRHGRRPAQGAGPLSRLVADSVSARHGVLLALVILGAAGALCVLLLPAARATSTGVLATRHATLPLDFPHERHRAVNCVACHHNFTDHTGAATCVACHRSARADLKLPAEPRFHGFCEGCHEQMTDAAGHRGPVRACGRCHRATPVGGADRE